MKTAQAGEALIDNRYALASIQVRRAATGKVDTYISADYIPPWKLRARRLYKRSLSDHMQGDNIYLEVPNHPIPFLRKRRSIA